MSRIGIAGSINTDLVSYVDKMPEAGETVSGTSFKITNGGKGANVAVAAARLNGSSKLFGCVGCDIFSESAIRNLEKENVDISCVEKIKNEYCGTAQILVTKKTNSIVVCEGANACLTPEKIYSMEEEMAKLDIIATQLEIPLESAVAVFEICKKRDIAFLFNPSPVKKVPEKIYKNADYILVNEIEIQYMEGYDSSDPLKILEKYSGRLILTKGKEGVYFYGKKIEHIPAIDLKPVDTTGAGDTFTGALMSALSNGKSLEDSIIFANTAAGLKTLKQGAQTGMPTIDEVNNFLKKNN